MNLDHYKAASERTDADERALIPGFKRIRPQSQCDHNEMVRDPVGKYGYWMCAKCFRPYGQPEKEPPADPDAAEALEQLEQANERNQ